MQEVYANLCNILSAKFFVQESRSTFSHEFKRKCFKDLNVTMEYFLVQLLSGAVYSLKLRHRITFENISKGILFSKWFHKRDKVVYYLIMIYERV